MSSSYAGQQIAFLTQHGKEQVIAPILEPALGCVIKHVTGFDTDQLGTFTRDIRRPGSQLDAARRKARIGMELSGLSLGMASEGSFDLDPFAGMFPWNIELLVLIDDRLGIEVVGMAQGPGHSSHVQASDWPAVESFAAGVGFPDHHLVLRPQDQDDTRVHKGVSDWTGLKASFEQCLAQSGNRQVFVETDLRAFANPSRMQHIEQAAQDLLKRLQSCCPECASPGYWVSERQPGLPCSVCGRPTSGYLTEVWKCGRCLHTSVQTRTDCAFAEPKHCASCNP
ncbi:DUF6671 family protein [Actimicrobium antarcticum]|uniref:DUF6671 domain-containing protein n=1 Tax=Actimicrobium antarcticum TaxID=1051899 RepID=A0ABP7U0Q6_9BURK